jgi:hypothetical protein
MTGLPGLSASPDRHVITPISSGRLQARSPILQQVYTRMPWHIQQEQQLQQDLAPECLDGGCAITSGLLHGSHDTAGTVLHTAEYLQPASNTSLRWRTALTTVR